MQSIRRDKQTDWQRHGTHQSYVGVIRREVGCKLPTRPITLTSDQCEWPDGTGHSLARQTDAGFSLIELLVVLAIFALAVGVAVPALRGPSGSQRLRILTIKVASDLQSARTNAVLLRRPVSIVFNADKHSYRVDDAGAPVSLPASVELVLASARQKASGAPAGRIVFYPDGSSTGARVTLSDHAASVSLDVEWLTGVVTLEGHRR